MNGLMVGFPPRSICSSTPLLRRLIDAHTPMTEPPSMSSGTSSTIESTLLSAKSSCPVHWKPVQGALDVGEERVAAQPGEQPDPARLDGLGRAVETDRD